MTGKGVLERFEKSNLWSAIIFISIFASIFGPPFGIIAGFSTLQMLILIFLSNAAFVIDSAIKTILYDRKYLLSLDFVIDISAIASGIMEFLFTAGFYAGPGLANLRVLRSLKLISRSMRSLQGIARSGKLARIGIIVRAVKGLGGIRSKSASQSNDAYVARIRQKMQTVVMLLMGYIIIRFGASTTYADPIREAWHDIFFFAEIIIVMIVIGAIIDYYLNKLIGQRFERIEQWVQRKSNRYNFFRNVNEKARKESIDEVEFLEQYIGIVLDKADEFPQSVRKFLWGVFKPQVHKRVIFLSDIENYSGQTADMSAAEVNKLLDEYVEKVVHILVQHGAEIDKYVGDSIIAFFDDKDADKAFEASRQISSLRGSMHTRIGLHYDSIIETYVGPKGYRQMDHFSEGISIAQRLEEHNKKTDTYVLISDDLYRLLSEKKKKRCQYLARFQPKGASHKIPIYTIK